jgi:hypothetical protein
MDALLGCLSRIMIKCKAHCLCGKCCESDCMVQEGGDLKRVDSSTPIKEHKNDEKNK